MRFVVSALTCLSALCLVPPVLGHHSFSAEFDVGRPVEFTGTVIDLEWVNPHAWLHLEVTNAEGEVERWKVELLGKNSLVRDGFLEDDAKIGARLSITGFGARDGTNTANASTVTHADTGESLWVSGGTDRN